MSTAELAVYGFTMGAVGTVAVMSYPFLARASNQTATAVERYHQVRVGRAARELDDLYLEVRPLWLKIAYGVGPIVTGLLLFFLSQNVWIACGGAVAGIIIPDVYVRQARATRLRRFRGQLVDALMILSSSLRAGLSLTQAFEQLESEMTPPASQEFGLVMRAYRLGQPFEEALERLRKRNFCDEVNIITTALLVARETGGDATKIITQLVGTIREKKKLYDKVNTLTLQGKLQAYIMSGLPIAFVFFAKTFDATYFDVLVESDTGHTIIMAAVGLWLVGMVLLMKLSKIEI